MIMPNVLSPIICTMICGALIAFGVLAHVSTNLDAASHHAAHQSIVGRAIAEAREDCPAGTRITVIENGKKTCLIEHVNGYGRADRLRYVSAEKI